VKSICIAALTLLCSGAIAVAQDGNAENGKRLYMTNGCYECHGTVAQGGTGPRLAPPAVPMATINAFARKGGQGMPPYSAKVMSDAELVDVRAYLMTIPAPPALNSIPILNQ
jgi:ubiquinol-cytochrome c reductase cytochrome c subunit